MHFWMAAQALQHAAARRSSSQRLHLSMPSPPLHHLACRYHLPARPPPPARHLQRRARLLRAAAPQRCPVFLARRHQLAASNLPPSSPPNTAAPWWLSSMAPPPGSATPAPPPCLPARAPPDPSPPSSPPPHLPWRHRPRTLARLRICRPRAAVTFWPPLSATRSVSLGLARAGHCRRHQLASSPPELHRLHLRPPRSCRSRFHRDGHRRPQLRLWKVPTVILNTRMILCSEKVISGKEEEVDPQGINFCE